MPDTSLFALVAAGGNSRVARSMRARLQWRDRFGRWIEMGRGVKFKVRGADGASRSVIGSFVGAVDDKTGQVYVSKDPNGLPDGFYNVSSSNAQEFVANLSESQLAERGIELGKNAQGDAVGERVAEDIPNINEMKVKKAPEGWEAQPGTFGGKRVIETEDGDFRIHFAGKDDTVLLEDHRANPGQADPQRSIAEAFKKVSDVDVQREESGDQSYGSLRDDNEEKLASMSRDTKVEQIKFNERQIQNPRVPIDARQAAMTNNETLKKELEAEGQPYDPEGTDSDEALASRKTDAPAASEAAEVATEETASPISTGDIDVSTFDVSPEGFLVPTGKRTNDISPEGLANFMTAEKEALGKGGARLVVDTDNNTAEIYNSADTLDNAKAQAGGIGVDRVLDLSAGKEISTKDDGETPVDPNSPEVNPNLEGVTTPTAPTGESDNGEDRNPDAVESRPAQPGADDPASNEPDAEAQQPSNTPGTGGRDGDRRLDEVESRLDALEDYDPTPTASGPRPDLATTRQISNSETTVGELQPGDIIYDSNGNLVEVISVSGTPDADSRVILQDESGRQLTRRMKPEQAVKIKLTPPAPKRPGTSEELQERRTQVATALKNAGNPRDIIDLNEQADELDNRISALETESAVEPETAPEVTTPETEESYTDQQLAELGDTLRSLQRDFRDAEERFNASITEEDDEKAQGDIDRIYDEISQIEDTLSRAVVAERAAQTRAEEPAPAQETAAPEGTDWAANPVLPTREEIKSAPTGAIVAEEHDESGDVRLFRKREDGRWESLGMTTGTKEPTGYTTTGDTLSSQGSNFHYVSDMEGTHPKDRVAPASEPWQDEMRSVESLDVIRMVSGINEDFVAELVEKFKATGYEGDPIQIERFPDGSETITDGNHRAEAAKRAGLSEVPVRVYAPSEEGRRAATTALVEAERRKEAPEPEAADTPRGQYVEPGDADATASARAEIDAIDAEIEIQLGLAETATDDQVEAEHLSRVKTLERQRKIQENALNRALGNEPMDLNGELGWNSRSAENRGTLPEAPAPVEIPEETPETDTPAVFDDELDASLAEARIAVENAEQRRIDLLLEDDWSDEDLDAAETARDEARDAVREISQQIELRDATEGPALPTEESVESTADRVLRESALSVESLDSIDPAEGGTGGVLSQSEDPNNTSPDHGSRVEVAKARLFGKDVSPEERSAIQEALDSNSLSDRQLSELEADIDSKPNRPDTTTVVRPDVEQPEYLSSADMEIVNSERNDPNYVFDEDLTWRKILEENPDATVLDNGDVLLESYTKTNGAGSKRYDVLVRRTKKNRFMVYLIETDQNGNRRAKRVGNTEWHSYEALEKRITRGRKLASGARPSSFFANNKETPTESLGVQAFPEDDFLGDIGNPDAPVPTTGDGRYDHLLEAVANHIRSGDADIEGIEAHLQEMEPGSAAVRTIMQAVIGRAQDGYRPDGTNPFQMHSGETAEIGMEFDWTDWHQEKDWWLPNGRLNPNRTANPNHGRVERGRIVGYVGENTDGKGRTYGDHVWVQLWDPQTQTWSNWTKRSAQTLRSAEPGSMLGAPFFSKREEWRSSPEALARRFRVPTTDTPNPQTHERPKRDLPQSKRMKMTSRGSLSGYSNVPVPKGPAEIVGMIARGDTTPAIRPVSEAHPGMMIVRRDDNGDQFVDTIIKVENLGDGGFRIHAARPDGKGFADVDSFVLPGDADVAIWSAPAIPAPETPAPDNKRRGELVEFDRDGVPTQGVVLFDDGKGNITVGAPGNETIDILESNIRPVEDPEISQDERLDLIDGLEDHEIPQYIKDLILRGLLSPGLSRARYDELWDFVRSYGSRSDKIRDLDQVLDMINATDQQRADAYEYLNASD